MENVSVITEDDEKMELPPGFRFHPTDEELITHYLSLKVIENSFSAIAIGEVDLNKVEPWDLPWRAKMGEKEWYFFCVRDRKYPTGMRTNRATDAGYWKATGKDKEIIKAKTLVGMKKTLVFYKGRAPRGEKTNWVMHEYRLEGKNSIHGVSKAAKNEWVICRIFKKCSGGKKIHISGLTRTSNYADYSGFSDLPPLMDLSSDEAQTTRTTVAEASHETCFSNPTEVEDQKPQHTKITNFNALFATSSSKTSTFSTAPLTFPKVPTPNLIASAQIMPSMETLHYTDSIFMQDQSSVPTPNLIASAQIMPSMETLHYTDSIFMQDQSTLRLLLEDNGQYTRQNAKAEFSQDTGMSTDMSYSPMSIQGADWRPYVYQECPITSTGPVDLDCLWNY